MDTHTMSFMSSPRPLRRFDDATEVAAARRAFIAAALDAVAGKDRLDFSVADVVSRSGWHKAAFYRLFGSKDALLLAVAVEAADRTTDALARHLARTSSPEEAVRVWTTVLLGRASTPAAAAAAQPFALDRHHLLQRFPDAEERLTWPIRSILHSVLRAANVPDAEAVGDAASELVMSQQATWLARGHRPSRVEVERCSEFVLRLAGLVAVPSPVV
jgi:AcrR family transcriptional regulator